MENHKIQHLNAIKGRVATFEDALRITGKTFIQHEFEEPDDVARKKAKIITEALNTTEDGKKWEADYANHNQWKYYVWACDYKPGSGFSAFFCDYDYSLTFVGSRLAFASSELALYAAKTFQEIYNEMLK